VVVAADGRLSVGAEALLQMACTLMPADTEVHISRFAELIATALVAGYRDQQNSQLLAEARHDVRIGLTRCLRDELSTNGV
jgi:hypothetical protein